MEQLLAHVTEYAIAYILIILCLLPVLYVTRRYSVPLIQYSLEIVLYLGLMHLTLWLLVWGTREFRKASSMRALESPGAGGEPEWGTPLLEFWNRAAYDPEWLFWVEVVFAVLIIYLVARYRPLKIQRGRAWKFNEKKAKGKAGVAYGGRQVGTKPGAMGRGARR